MTAKMWLLAAAMGMICVTSGAQAATIVQFDSEQGGSRGFAGFDSALGTLNKVTLAINLSKSRVWQISVPSSTTTSSRVSWSVDGNWRLGSGISGIDGTLVPLTGTGTSMVTLDRFTDDGRAVGFFQVNATGSTTLDLAPESFVGRSQVFNGFDLGHNGNVGDTSFSFRPENSRLMQLSGSCFVNGDGNPSQPIGEDFCGAAHYTLTYEYAAVPEPATWGMMLLGFGTMGVALRRRRTAVAA